MSKYFRKKTVESLGCPPGNHILKFGCPVPFYGCPGRSNTQFVKTFPYLNILRYTLLQVSLNTPSSLVCRTNLVKESVAYKGSKIRSESW